MALFSGKQSGNDGAIPPEILAAVRTMADDQGNGRRTEGSVEAVMPQSSSEKGKTDTPLSGSPFLDAGEVHSAVPAPLDFNTPPKEATSGKSPFSAGIPEPNKAGAGRFPAVPLSSSEVVFSQPKGKKSLLIAVAIVVIVALIGLGTYMYLRGVPAEEMTGLLTGENPQDTTTPPLDDTPIVVSEPPFALDKPNYLSMDTETVSPEAAKKVFSEAAAKMQAANVTQPVEFLITDTNNNPVAFSRFAYLMQFGLSTDLLALLDERFSVFAYIDNGHLRLGLSLTMKDQVAVAAQIAKEESSLPSSFRPLILLDGSVASVSSSSVFRSGSYNSEAVRFTNIDAKQGLSFDYCVRGNSWFIGTSKDTLRAVLDGTR